MLAGRKKALLQEQIIRIEFSRLEECSKAKMFPIAKANPDIWIYMPDKWKLPEDAERSYLIDVMCTLLTDFMREYVADAWRQRNLNKQIKA